MLSLKINRLFKGNECWRYFDESWPHLWGYKWTSFLEDPWWNIWGNFTCVNGSCRWLNEVNMTPSSSSFQIFIPHSFRLRHLIMIHYCKENKNFCEMQDVHTGIRLRNLKIGPTRNRVGILLYLLRILRKEIYFHVIYKSSLTEPSQGDLQKFHSTHSHLCSHLLSGFLNEDF